MMLIAGLVLLALGLVCGALLLLIPLGVVPGEANLALWLLFPAFAIGGYLMAASAAADRNSAILTRASGAALMLLALAAAVGLVLKAASVIHPESDSLALWYVLVVGLVLGGMGIASRPDRKAA
jgi:hypothetical protein